MERKSAIRWNGGDLTAITSVGSIVTTDPALAGPEPFPFAGGQVKNELVQPDGKRVVAGHFNGNVAVARYNVDGTLDASFGGGDGKSINDLGTASDRALNMSLRADGKIVLLGVTAGSGDAWQFAAVRLNPDGTLDTTFADNGKLFSGLGRAPSYGGVAVILADGRIHMTGWDGSKSKAMAFDADGKNGFDRLDKLSVPLRAASVPVAARAQEGTLQYFAQGESVGPDAPETMLMHAQANPSVNEGSDYALSLSMGDGWTIKWDQAAGPTETIAGHPSEYAHAYPDGPATHTITATSKSIYLQGNEKLTPATTKQVIEAETLTLASGTALDLNDNDLIVNNGAFSTLQALVFEGYSIGDTNKTGIISTAGQIAGGSTILALFNNALVGILDWPEGSGQTISSNAIVGKYTYLGDTNMDGQVAAQDYTAVDANIGATGLDLGIAWFYGDTNFDSDVGAQDYTGIDATLGLGAGNPLVASGRYASPVRLGQDVDVNNVAPTLYMGPYSAITNSLQLESRDPGNDSISNWGIDWGDGATPSSLGSVSVAPHVYASPGAYTVTATATDDDGAWLAPSVQVGFDNFDGRTALGPNWIAQQGQFTVTGNRIVSAKGNNTATFSTFSAADVSIQGQFDLTANLFYSDAGFVARYTHPATGDPTFYRGKIERYGAGPYWYAQIEKQTTNGQSPQVIIREEINNKMTLMTGTLRFDVIGNSLGLYLNGEIVASCVDNAIPSAGLVGVYGYGATGPGVALDSFAATQMNSTATVAQLPYQDDFDRPNSPSLGSAWTRPEGKNIFAVDTGSAVALPHSGPALATLDGISQSNVSVSADFDLTNVVTGEAGVVARYSSTTPSFYHADIKLYNNALCTLYIYKKIGNQQIELKNQSIPVTKTGRLRLEVVNDKLALFLNDALMLQATDTSPLAGGSVGIFGDFNQVRVDHFSSEVRQTQVAAPTWLSAADITSYSARLSWTHVPGVTGYRVERRLTAAPANAWSPTNMIPPNASNYELGGFGYGSTYDVRIIAIGSVAESLPSEFITITLGTPLKLTAAGISSSSASLRWSSNGNEKQFTVEEAYLKEIRQTLDGPVYETWFRNPIVLPKGTTSWKDTTLSFREERWYRVRADFEDGSFHSSNFASARSLSPGQFSAQTSGATTAGAPSGGGVGSDDTSGVYRVSITSRSDGDEGGSGATGDLTVNNNGFIFANSPEEAVTTAVHGTLFVPENAASFAFPDFPYLIGPFTGQNDGSFTGQIQLDNDYNDWYDWKWIVKVERAEVNSLTASADGTDAVAVSSSAVDDGAEINIAQAADGSAVIEVKGSTRPDDPSLQSKARWKITAGGTEVDSGQLNTAGYDQVSLDPATDGLEYVLVAGIDINGNSTLEDNEVTQRIDVHVISLVSLTVKDSVNPSLTKTNDANPPGNVPHLYIPVRQDGTASIELSAIIAPDTAEAKQRVVWELDDSDDGWIDDGNFTNARTVVISPAENYGYYDYKVVAGVDVNNDGYLQPEEVTREVDVHLVDLQDFIVTDSTNVFNKATATELLPTGIQHLYLAEQDNGSAAVKLSAAIFPATTAAKGRIIWEVDNAAGVLVDSGDFNNLRTVSLDPSGNRDFYITSGFDVDGNGILSLTEVTREVDVHVFQLEFQPTYSDQIPGSTSNSLPGGSGRNPNFILMGTRPDNRAYVHSGVTITGDSPSLDSRLKFALVPIGLASWSYSPSFAFDGGTLAVSNQVDDSDSEIAVDMKVVYGMDFDSDGSLSKQEVLGWSPHLLKVVDQSIYNTAMAEVASIYTSGSFGGPYTYPYSSNFLYSFANNVGLSGAANDFVSISAMDFRLSHHVGGGGATGEWSVRNAVFDWSSPATTLPYDIATSPEIIALTDSLLEAHRQEIYDAVVAQETDYNFGPWTLPASGISFTGLTDLHFAIGSAALSNMQVKVHARIKTPSIPGPLLGTFPVVATCEISGTLTDLYDFNYDSGTLPRVAAIVQAGYPTLGNGGHVFTIEVHLNNLTPHEYIAGERTFA